LVFIAWGKNKGWSIIMNVLFMGHYDPEYPRNVCIIKGLRKNGVTVHEIRVELSRRRRLFNLIKGWKAFCKKNAMPDVIIVPMIDLETFPFVLTLSKIFEVPIVYDAFVCRYAAWVHERKNSPTSIKSKLLYILELFTLKLSDLVLVDTKAHADLFIQLYKIYHKKIHVIYVSLDDELYNFSAKNSDKPFVVQFIGYFHPLTGADTIIRAAALLCEEKEIVIELIGIKDDPQSKTIMDLAKSLKVQNIKFMQPVPYTELPNQIKRANVCLGVFGDTDQAARVFPNKGYQALAMAKPLITRDCKALLEILEPGIHVEVVPPGNPRALADAILKIKNNPEYRKSLSENAYEYFKTNLTPLALGYKLSRRLKDLIEDKADKEYSL
jgi:glycosyltransferase involved in cell wall biosynthesis